MRVEALILGGGPPLIPKQVSVPMPQVVSHVHVITQPVENVTVHGHPLQISHSFSRNLFQGCGGDVCLSATFCPCLVVGANDKMLTQGIPVGPFDGSGSSACVVSGILHSCSFVLGMFCSIVCCPAMNFYTINLGALHSHAERTRLRHAKGILGNCPHDCVLHYFCGPCALAQEYRELSMRINQPPTLPQPSQLQGQVASAPQIHSPQNSVAIRSSANFDQQTRASAQSNAELTRVSPPHVHQMYPRSPDADLKRLSAVLYCGACGVKFASDVEKFCRECGAKR